MYQLIKSTSQLLLTVLMFCQCTAGSNEGNLSRETATHSLVNMIRLQPDTTTLFLEDFFKFPDQIDSILLPEAFDFGWNRTSASQGRAMHTVDLRYKQNSLKPISILRIWVDGQSYEIALLKSPKVDHVFTFDPKGQKFQSVQFAGSINNWNPNTSALSFQDGKWQIDLKVAPGSYQYQIVLDGNWILDPANPDSADNNIGGYNSVLTIGADEPDKHRLYTKEITRSGEVIIGTSAELDSVFIFWQNHQILAQKSNKGYLLQLPKAAEEREYSFVRAIGMKDNSLTNDLLIPLNYGLAGQSSADLSSKDHRKKMVYFAMIDRFFNGDQNNDEPIADPEVHFKANYQGGDIAGLEAKLNEAYFHDLGMNTLWISPLTQNPLKAYREWPAPHKMYSGYHGYWPISSTKVDHRFGTNDELKNFVEFAQDNDMEVLLDFVANHVHEDHPMILANPTWKTQLDLPDGIKNIRIWDEHRLTTWFDTFLPSLDFSNQEVIDAQVDSALFWLNEIGVDGFRHDATKHIPVGFWRALTRKIKSRSEDHHPFQIGETFGSDELIGSYIGSGMLDAQFDFNLYFEARAVFALAEEPFTRLKTALENSLKSYGQHHLMGNISGNHDMPRFISYASGALTFAEDAKAAGWERKIEVKDPVGYGKLKNLHAFNFFIPGIPIVYYGDEIGMAGANDPDNRRMMQFEGLNKNQLELKDCVTKLAELRANSMALTYGTTEILHADASSLVMQRTYFNEAMIIAFNKAEMDIDVEIELPVNYLNVPVQSHFESDWQQDGNMLKVTLPSNSFEIFELKN